MKLNPIVKKDLQVTARSMRLSWGVFAYEAVLVIAFLFAMWIIEEEQQSFYSSGNIYSSMVYLFPVIAIIQACIVALIVPILTASSISGEKERQTFDIMLTTCMSPFSIVLGKVISAVIRILFYVVASLPIMALSFVVGGVKWSYLFYYLLAIILLSVFSGSIGILSSSLCKGSISAVILSFCFYGIVYGMTFLPLLIETIIESSRAIYTSSYTANIGESLLFLLFNPLMFFEEFFMFIMTGNSLISEANFSTSDVGYITYLLTRADKVWMFVSAACILALSIFFMVVASWKVNPMNTVTKRKKRKKKTE